MKAKFFALMALVLGLAACQNDPEGLNVNADGTVNTTLSVALPDAVTRAADADSAKGGLSNVDLGEYDIRYILEVYNDEGELVKERATKVSDDATVVFDLRLIPNRNYNFVVWADFVTDGNDLYYNTAAGLRDVTVVEDEWTAMTEARDAYTGVKRIEGYNSQSTINLTLTRPFGKLRVVTTDIAELYNILPKDMKIEYRNGAYTGFDAFAAKAQGTEVAKTFEYTLPEVYNDYADDANRTLFADYLFGTEDGTMQFDMYVKYDDGVESTTVVNFNTAIPVERNKLTTVKGNLLTDDNDFTVTIDDNFGGYINDGGDVITTNEELKAALTQNVENIAVVLGADLTFDVNSSRTFNMGGDKTKTITISGMENTRAAEPYTLTFNLTDSDWSNVITDATLVLKNLNINTSGYNTGHWKRTHLNFNCDVEMENVTTTPIELGGNSVVKSVTINNAYTDNYALWIGTRGQVVDIDGLVINSADNGNRGIKIADEDREDKSVTLNIKNAKFNTTKKAAILVTTNYGATINAGENVNIENVAADPINLVWIDEDRPATIDDVVVTGCTKVVEGSADANIVIVTNAEELQKAIDATAANATAETTIYLKKGTYQGSFNVTGSRRVVLTTNEAVTIDGLVHGDSGNYITLRNLTLTNEHPGTSSTTRHQADGYCLGGYVNCFVIENCTFDIKSTGGINIYAAFNACQNEYELTVKNCVFNCNGLTPIRCKTNTIVDGCTFNDQKRYSMQFQANYQAASEKVVFTNNIVNNPCATSDEDFAAGVQISHSQLCEGVALTISNNTLNSTDPKYSDLKFAYDHEEASSSFGNIKITTCTLNGQPITESMCFEINADTNEVSFTMSKPEVEDEAYVITNAKELFWFANEVNANGNNFSGKTVKLGADIDLENAEWTPVGQTGATQFMGTFDGKNYTISNLNVDKTSETGEYYSSGLFGWLNAATVKNVKVNGATVKGNHNVGVIAGYLETAGCTIENCYVVGAAVECHHANDYACGDKAGVIVGHAGNSGVAVKNCTATDSTLSAGRDAGQIVGAAKEANVTGCSATNVKVTANGECTGANVRNEVIGRLL